MPQLLSRMDSVGWLTPPAIEILDPPPELPYDDRFRRGLAVALQKHLKVLDVPARVVRVVVFPSHLLYVLRGDPGQPGIDADRIVQGIVQALPYLRFELHLEAVGLVPEIHKTTGYVGLLVRMAEHTMLPLRSLLSMSAFQADPSQTLLALGMGLDQQAVTRDLEPMQHLLIAGHAADSGAMLRTLVLNLALFNTPAELRLGLLCPGHSRVLSPLEGFAGLAHVLGNRLRDADESLRLLEGLAKECTRRRQIFGEHNAVDLETYNARMHIEGEATIPRIVIVIENLLDDGWMLAHNQWFDLIRAIHADGGPAGVHLLVAADTDDDVRLPGFLEGYFKNRVLMGTRTAETGRLPKHAAPFPAAFVDGFMVEDGRESVPLMFGHVSDEEIGRTVQYWQDLRNQRNAERQAAAEIEIEDMIQIEPVLEAAEPVEEKHRLPPPPPPTHEALVRATELLAPGQSSHTRARALAAYLGWLSIGPLRDVLELSEAEAHRVILDLQAGGLLEAGDGPIWRFTRLNSSKP